MCAFFAVDLATGEQMIRSIGQMQTEVNIMLNQLSALRMKVNLGDLEEARAVSTFNEAIAFDGDQSAHAALTQFRDSLNVAAAAVQQGMANYAEVEAAIEQEQRGLAERRLDAPPRPPMRGGMRAV